MTSLAEPLTGPRRRRAGRVRVRPTAAGGLFIAIVPLGILVAINYSSNLVFALSFLLCGVVVAAFWQTGAALVGLRGEIRAPHDAFSGGEIAYRVHVEAEDGGDLPAAPVAAAPIAAVMAGAAPAWLGEREEGIAHLHCPVSRRGVHPGGPVHLVTTYPLGLFRARLPLGEAPEALVFPHPAADCVDPPGRSNDAAQHTEADTFAGLRVYAPGDRISHIAWKAMARGGETLVKTFDGLDGQPVLWLCWDDAPGADVEARLSVLTRWVLDAATALRPYGLRLPGTVVEPELGPAHRRRCLTALATFEPGA